jgi:hypothetical protein
MAGDLVTVGTFQFLPEAEAARLHLESEGIPAFLADAETVNMNWLLGNAIGYIKLQVPRAQAEAARDVLETMRASRSREPAARAESSQAIYCRYCDGELAASESTCPTCGRAIGGDESDLLENDPADSSDEDLSDETPMAMDSLRAIRRPLLLLLLLPMLVLVGFLLLTLVYGIFALLAWLVDALL